MRTTGCEDTRCDMLHFAMMRTIRHFLIFQTTRFWIAVLGMLPLVAHRPLARLLAIAARLLAPRDWRRCSAQLHQYLLQGQHPARIRLLCHGVFVQLAQSVLELSRLLRHPDLPPPVTFSPGSEDALRKALAANRGVVYITGHIGNWELMAVFLSQQGFPIHTVAARSHDPRFTQYIAERRARFGISAIYRDDPDSAVKLVRAVKQNSILGVLIDQDTRVKSVFVPFFGSPASTPSGIVEFALRTDTPVVVGSIHRCGNGSHLITVAPVSLPSDITAATAHLTAALEARIRRHPTQWVWLHRRWKTQA